MVVSVIQQLDGIIFSSMDLGNYDNDGDLDLLITGVGNNGRVTTIYNNTNGTFSDASANLLGVQNGNAVFVDIDTDGDLDVIINGYDTNTDNSGALYTNENGLFSLGSLPFTSAESWIAMGDYDNDRDLDLVFASTDNNFDDKVYLYVNNGTAFNLASQGLLNLGSYANLNFSDFDGDNNLDFLISGGSDADGYDGKTHFYENTIASINVKPIAPTNLFSQLNSDDSITFTWDTATDDLTPSDGLFYYLTLGTTENGSEIASYK
jgi:hypothetical protein